MRYSLVHLYLELVKVHHWFPKSMKKARNNSCKLSESGPRQEHTTWKTCRTIVKMYHVTQSGLKLRPYVCKTSEKFKNPVMMSKIFPSSYLTRLQSMHQPSLVVWLSTRHVWLGTGNFLFEMQERMVLFGQEILNKHTEHSKYLVKISKTFE
jgi:hypothetical protein